VKRRGGEGETRREGDARSKCANGRIEDLNETKVSFQPFLFFHYPEKQNKFLELFTPLGDTINNLTIHTSKPPSDPFDKDMIIILIADRGVEQKVGAAARRAGYPASILNTLIIPSAVTHLLTRT
jgi:hypothetical protein